MPVTYKNILYEMKDRTAWITINRPDKLNALNHETTHEIGDALKAARDDAAVRVIVLTGAEMAGKPPEKQAFIAGADIGELATLPAFRAYTYTREGHEIINSIEFLGKPVIAAINGYALGGGCELAMACHLRIAAATAQFGQPEIKIGIMPGWGGTQRLARLVGRANAVQLTLTGKRISADEAFRIGLVNQVVPYESLKDEVTKLAAEIAGNAPLAVRAILDVIASGADQPLDDALQMEAVYFGLLFSTEDKTEGLKAFLEKRAAQWKGA
ncbi:MAG: enoyl-CoA hydratase/isomerase family protein [bacterium]